MAELRLSRRVGGLLWKILCVFKETLEWWAKSEQKLTSEANLFLFSAKVSLAAD